MTDDEKRMLKSISDNVTDTRERIIRVEAEVRANGKLGDEVRADVKDHRERITAVETRSKSVLSAMYVLISGFASMLFYLFRDFMKS